MCVFWQGRGALTSTSNLIILIGLTDGSWLTHCFIALGDVSSQGVHIVFHPVLYMWTCVQLKHETMIFFVQYCIKQTVFVYCCDFDEDYQQKFMQKSEYSQRVHIIFSCECFPLGLKVLRVCFQPRGGRDEMLIWHLGEMHSEPPVKPSSEKDAVFTGTHQATDTNLMAKLFWDQEHHIKHLKTKMLQFIWSKRNNPVSRLRLS